MSKKITIEIDAPPEGWVHEKRLPKEGEDYICFDMRRWRDEVDKGSKSPLYHSMPAYAYRIRDEYAERYEALKLPDGWAWDCGQGVIWRSEYPGIVLGGSAFESFRRIVNGKAVKP